MAQGSTALLTFLGRKEPYFGLMEGMDGDGSDVDHAVSDMGPVGGVGVGQDAFPGVGEISVGMLRMNDDAAGQGCRSVKTFVTDEGSIEVGTAFERDQTLYLQKTPYQ